jgi:predicted transcriptional regulator with HTH domain
VRSSKLKRLIYLYGMKYWRVVFWIVVVRRLKSDDSNVNKIKKEYSVSYLDLPGRVLIVFGDEFFYSMS